MAKIYSKVDLAYEMKETSGNVYRTSVEILNGLHKKLKREDLVSALVFIKKAEEILKQK